MITFNEVESQINDDVLKDTMEHHKTYKLQWKSIFPPVIEGLQWLRNTFMYSLTE
jgi:hypothetical protein